MSVFGTNHELYEAAGVLRRPAAPGTQGRLPHDEAQAYHRLVLARVVAGEMKRWGMPLPDDIVVVAVSGGADSVCLLQVLHELEARIVVAHLDHGIRQESRQDAEFVRGLAEQLGAECVCERRDVPAYRRQRKLSLEAAAREVRHQFLRDSAARIGASAIFLAHTADDQVETLLLRLIRGAGPKGLSGMRPRDGLLCRPMLGVWREQVLGYLHERGLSWREDASNADPAMLRNRVRHELLPLLTSMNPGIRQVLLHEAELLGERQRDVEAEVLRQLGLGSGQIFRALDGQAVMLKGGRRLTIEGESREPEVQGSFDVALPVPGETRLPGIGVVSASAGGEGQVLDAGKVTGPLRVRSRWPGDWFVPLGMSGHKKLQDFLIDEHIPRAQRARIPVVVDGDTIVWVAGMRLDERYKVTGETRSTLCLTFEPA